MRILLIFSLGLAMATVFGCDAGHGYTHDDKSHSNNHKSID